MPAPRLGERDAQMAHQYQQGATMAEIGVAFGCSRQRVQQILVTLGVARRPAGRPIGTPRRVVTTAERQQLAAQYRAGASLRRLGREYQLGENQVRRLLEAQQLRHDPAAAGAKRRCLTPAQEQEAVRRYQAGGTYPQLAEQFRCTTMTIWRTLRRCGVPPRRPGARGPHDAAPEA
jgi:Mor family transcriptional regulator